MWQQYQRYKALNPPARKLFRAAVALFIAIRASLRFRGFRKTQQWLQRRLQVKAARSAPSADSNPIALTCRMVKAGGRYGLIQPTCLEESLALWYLLRQGGVSSQLRIGVRKLGSKFEAHAWIEYQGQAINESKTLHPHYAAFDGEFSEMPSEPL